jgi:hypothetical protein
MVEQVVENLHQLEPVSFRKSSHRWSDEERQAVYGHTTTKKQAVAQIDRCSEAQLPSLSRRQL